MVNKELVKRFIREWPPSRMRELSLKLGLWAYYVGTTANQREWIEYEIRSLTDSFSNQALLIKWVDSHELTNEMEDALGCFLPEGHKDYFDITAGVSPYVMQHMTEWADGRYREYLNSLFNK